AAGRPWTAGPRSGPYPAGRREDSLAESVEVGGVGRQIAGAAGESADGVAGEIEGALAATRLAGDELEAPPQDLGLGQSGSRLQFRQRGLVLGPEPGVDVALHRSEGQRSTTDAFCATPATSRVVS